MHEDTVLKTAGGKTFEGWIPSSSSKNYQVCKVVETLTMGY